MCNILKKPKKIFSFYNFRKSKLYFLNLQKLFSARKTQFERSESVCIRIWQRITRSWCTLWLSSRPASRIAITDSMFSFAIRSIVRVISLKWFVCRTSYKISSNWSVRNSMLLRLCRSEFCLWFRWAKIFSNQFWEEKVKNKKKSMFGEPQIVLQNWYNLLELPTQNKQYTMCI